MTGGLDDRVALVTGGSHNIGRAVAMRLAQAGATVALTYRADELGATETVKTIISNGGRAVGYQASLEEPNVPEALAHMVATDLGPVDVLVNTAAIRPRSPIGEVAPEGFDVVFAVNVRAPYLLAQAVAPSMATRGFGRLVFLGGLASYVGREQHGLVMASKLAVVGAARSFAIDLAPYGVTSNVIVPGRIAEEETDNSDTGTEVGSSEREDGWPARTPLGRVGTPEEVAAMVAFLVSPEASYLTGQELFLTGGAFSAGEWRLRALPVTRRRNRAVRGPIVSTGA